jgi:hypothetical protein
MTEMPSTSLVLIYISLRKEEDDEEKKKTPKE